ncbi:MAG: FAD-binding oxidoreductase [bacterium]
MAQIKYQEAVYIVEENESVLDCLLRNEISVSYSCKNGTCQTCMMQALDGTPPPQAQKSLKDTLKAQNYFLACQCHPTENMIIGQTGLQVESVVKQIQRLNEQVVELILSPQDDFDYYPGQFVHLIRDDGLVRSYSIASYRNGSTDLHLHVQRVPNGRMSNWIHDELNVGDTVSVRGPAGDCFYVSGNPEQPLLLVGTGTGLAPLYGIAQDALLQNHQGEIYLYHGSLRREGLYLVDKLRELEAHFPNFHYVPCVLQGEPEEGIVIGNIESTSLAVAANFKGWRVYLCGNPDLVFSLRKQVFLKGASSRDIFSDAFILTKN